jgi:hypothetical protein
MAYPHNCKYSLLISSLPPHKNLLFEEKQTPLSRIQLNKRLALLEPEDAVVLEKIEKLLHWSHMTEDIDAEFVCQTLQSIDTIDNDFVKNIIIWRLEVRIVLAALRMRQAGMQSPPDKKILGFDFEYFFITHYWNEPDLGLGHKMPWLGQAQRLLQQGESYQLEKLMFSIVWDHYKRQSFGHYFNFEAVIIYVLRWDIVNRWSRNDQQAALARFNQLVDAGLKSVDLW